VFSETEVRCLNPADAANISRYGKGKVIPLHTMEAYGVRGGIAPAHSGVEINFHKLCYRFVMWCTTVWSVFSWMHVADVMCDKRAEKQSKKNKHADVLKNVRALANRASPNIKSLRFMKNGARIEQS
jgi:hypothetical protein